MKRSLTSFCLILLLSALVTSPTHSAGTKLWNFTQIETWLQGDFQGTGLTSRGTVVPTMLTERTDLPARLAWKSVPVGNGHFIATSLPAGIYLQTANGDVSNIMSLDQLGVTAMERHDDQIYAGASPSGTIYQYNANENSSDARSFEAVATLSDSYVWDMEASPDGDGLYIASGPNGSLHHLDRAGNLTRVTTVPAHNIMTLTTHNGSLYLGDDRGGVYKLDADEGNDSSLTSVYGFTRGEVASISSDGDHLYLAVNIRQASGQQRNEQEQISNLAAQLRQQSMRQQLKQRIKASPKQALQQTAPTDSPLSTPTTEADSKPSIPTRPTPQQSTQSMLEAVRQSAESGQSDLFQGLSGTLVYKMNPPEKMNIVYNDPNEIVHDLEAHDGTLYVATGGKGRLYKIKPDFTRVAYFQSNQKLVLNVELEDGQPTRITTGEGAAIYHRQPFNRRDVYYRSQPLDAQLLSQWGTLKSIGSSNLRFRTRSGNSNDPDTNWNQWSSFKQGNQISVPSDPARFLQFEARFRSPESQLKNVQIAYRIPNQQPQIGSFDISPNPYRMSVTQSHSPGGNGESSQGSSPGASQASQSGPMNVRQLGWKAMDPDGDQLASTVYYRPIGTSQWLTLVSSDEIEGSSYNWNLGDYSDGWYELRLEVSDQSQNPPGEGHTVYQQLGPVLVDNTAPAIRNLNRSDGTVSFTAQDETSWILRAEYRVDGEDWRPLQPTDGIFDQRRESFNFELSGEDISDNSIIEVRAMDEGGNVTLRRIDPR